MFNFIQSMDIKILLYINQFFHNAFMDKFMIFMSTIGNLGMVWIAIAAVLIITKKYRKTGFMLLGAVILTAILGEGILKHLVRRGRPFQVMEVSNMLIQKPMSYSFPSGHTSSSFAAAGVLSKEFKKYGPVFWIAAVLIAYSRMYLYVHFPSDVLGGAILGLVSAFMIRYFFRYLKDNFNSRKI